MVQQEKTCYMLRVIIFYNRLEEGLFVDHLQKCFVDEYKNEVALNC